MELEFSGEVFTWRGPSPYYFVAVPDAECAALEDAASFVSYGWGMVPVVAEIGATSWETSLWPKDGAYVVPLRARIRTAERIDEGDVIAVRLTVAL